MLRISLVLFLVCASAQAMAQNGRNAATGGCPSEEAQDREAQAPNPAPAKASTPRSKYARPTAVPSGGGNDEVLPRARGSKWHSFLPGMFR